MDLVHRRGEETADITRILVRVIERKRRPREYTSLHNLFLEPLVPKLVGLSEHDTTSDPQLFN